MYFLNKKIPELQNTGFFCYISFKKFCRLFSYIENPVCLFIPILQFCHDTPYDTRHTFTTMWKEKKLDETMRRKIQEHSGKGIGEMVYTHLDFQKLCVESNKRRL